MAAVATARRWLSSLAGMTFGSDRDLYETFGYPRYVSAQMYGDLYLRQDLAARIVDAFPDATWREQPTLHGDEQFLSDWETIQQRLQLWRVLHRLDRLTGLGHYGVLFLGLDGGESTHRPAGNGPYNLLFAQPHSERTAQITQWDDNPASPRYGMPEMYRLTTGTNWTGTGGGHKSINVHHSRVIHVAERALEDESIGTPRLERVYNRLIDLEKLLGGSAEVFWQNAAQIRAYVADSDVEWSPEEQEVMGEQIEEMQHGLRRDLRLRGVTPQTLGGDVADPSNHIDKQLDAIAGAAGVPKRILIGSERGELSSEQDENNWAARIDERREQHVGPNIIEQLIDQGQKRGFLRGRFEELEWPESDTLGEKGRAEIAQSKLTALNSYVKAPGADLVVAPEEVRDLLGLDGPAPAPVEEEPLPEDDEEVQAQWEGH